MKIALVTTTINIPTVLKFYRALGPDVRFFVVGDENTPHQEARNIVEADGVSSYYDVLQQKELGYKCSELIGWCNIQRRNIGFLEALKWGADVIVSIDDDNIPVNKRYFWDVERVLDRAFDGVEVFGFNWFDPGQLLLPPAKHRGFPIDIKSLWGAQSTTDTKVGVVAGLCLGDPDIDAVTRIATAPMVHGVHELARAGVVVDPRKTKTVFNSQNTSFIRELAPAMFMIPGTGRYDDIYASLITQRVMRKRDLYVHFGQPFVFQQRNQHNLVKDLRAEIDGMEKIAAFADVLDSIMLTGQSVLDDTRTIFDALSSMDFLTRQEIEAGGLWPQVGQAWLDDIESVL